MRKLWVGSNESGLSWAHDRYQFGDRQPIGCTGEHAGVACHRDSILGKNIAPILRGFPFFVKAGEAKYRCIGMTITKNNIYQIPRRDEDENSSGRCGN